MNTQLKNRNFIAIKIADYTLALSIDAVVKVVTCPPRLIEQLQTVGLAQIGHRTIAILNLYEKIKATYSFLPNNPSVGAKFLLIAQTKQGEFCGFCLNEPPNLIEIPASSIQPIPNSYNHTGLLDWFSHIAIIPQKDTTTGLLILDVNQVLHKHKINSPVGV